MTLSLFALMNLLIMESTCALLHVAHDLCSSAQGHVVIAVFGCGIIVAGAKAMLS